MCSSWAPAAAATSLMALAHDARRIDAVELDPRMTGLVADTYADFAGHIYDDPRVTVHTAEARGFVAGSDAALRPRADRPASIPSPRPAPACRR